MVPMEERESGPPQASRRQRDPCKLRLAPSPQRILLEYTLRTGCGQETCPGGGRVRVGSESKQEILLGGKRVGAGRAKSQLIIQGTGKRSFSPVDASQALSDMPQLAWNHSEVPRCAYHLTQLHPTNRRLATLRRLNCSSLRYKARTGRIF